MPVAERLADLREKAACFRQQFENLFWDEERGFYTQAVGWDDGCKCWVRNGVLASNIHYLIGSGLIGGERLRATIQQVTDPAWGLFNPEVGIRTVSKGEAFYDPEAYQQGSSWTFDTALAALHLKQERRACLRSGDTTGAVLCSAGLAAFTNALFQVFASTGSHFAEHLHGDTGAELLSGNTPQLWSIAAWLRTESLLMGLEVDARHGEIHLNPSKRLQAFTLLNVSAGTGRISLRYHVDAEQPVDVLENTSGCRVLLHEREPAAMPDRDVWQRLPEREHPQAVHGHTGSGTTAAETVTV
jgi:glycogen debranching enzyme